ncbi:AAA domain-containing protein, putative AbiEii toxin, Type IV TA system [Paenibacillus algorifonticola]|uniref:AAA domain-containing protein, putative AbiEii toxin, Type IV TA system n=1 Tax=Paenibacillus algorifonticola TaxID=684063 RepID=A0A1I2J5Q4_9BACL|nr:AAA family ATPase [Paenibacillus algorifonticola]SFF48286.1 AAA domain-containing protein, putative AbiEii toxin, Type IV TA system [Paenibacillus algorifonticola]
MNKKVRISEIEIQNLKNVVSGKIAFPCSKTQSFDSADVLGIYGQNGSGKTTAVDAFQILHTLLNGKKLENKIAQLIYQDSETASLTFSFLIESDKKRFELSYTVDITKLIVEELENTNLDRSQNEMSVMVSKEEIKYKEIKKGSRPKIAIQYFRINDDDHSIGPTALYNKIKLNKNDLYVSYKVNSQLSFKESTSFFFRKEGVALTKGILDKEVYELLHIIKDIFANNLFVVDNQQSSLTLANILIPVQAKKKDFDKAEVGYGVIVLPNNEPAKLTFERFEMISSMFNSISKVLKEIIPGLTVEYRSLGKETLKDGSIGMSAQLVAIREGKVLPISSESDGIKKLISILSSLIVMYNDPNACIIIDELDAGIFEYLLGEIVKILNDCGKGQLLFTSHNLRLLEVLNKENLVFTSTNSRNRYINLKGIKETNNIRDVYFRAIQLGTDDETVYEVTDRYYIMDAFEEAGESPHG